MKSLLIILSLFCSSMAFAMVTKGNQYGADNESIYGHSYLTKFSAYEADPSYGCDKLTAEAEEAFKIDEVRAFGFVTDYVFLCMYGNMFVQIVVEPDNQEQIENLENYIKSVQGRSLMGKNIEYIKLAVLDLRTTFGVKKVNEDNETVIDHVFKDKRKFQLKNFSDYFVLKNSDRLHFVHDTEEEFNEFVSGLLPNTYAKYKELFPKINYIHEQFYPLYTLEDGTIIDSIWVDGVFRNTQNGYAGPFHIFKELALRSL